MGKLNQVQDRIFSKMSPDKPLGDVSFPFNGQNVTSVKYNANNPTGQIETQYTGKGIFGLSFNVTDSNNFQIELNDQKAILFERYTTLKPSNQDTIVYDDWVYIIVEHKVIPAGNGWVLQLRALSKKESDEFLKTYPSMRTFPSSKTFIG